MQDVALYQQILGLTAPWEVVKVELNLEQQQIHVYVSHPRETKFACPECAQSLACYDHVVDRQWRHLDSCQFQTILHANVPRVNCPEHGVKQVNVPWAEKGSRYTILFERLAIDILLHTQTITGAMAILNTKWEQTWNILQRAVTRGQTCKQAQPLPHIGIDEKAITKGHNYITLLYDLEQSTVEAISDGRDTSAGIACFSQLSEAQVASVEAVAMDMSESYVNAAKQVIPLAEHKIVHDRFHVMQLANKAVDTVRKREHRKLLGDDDTRLVNTKYIWLKSQENLTPKESNLLDATFSLQLETGKAWAYKEMLRDVWNHDSASEATQYFKDWYNRVIHTKLEPMKRLARTIKERLANVVSYCTHGITNGVAEGINSKIMSIKRRVRGFRNNENFKKAIFFYCGGLQLHPH